MGNTEIEISRVYQWKGRVKLLVNSCARELDRIGMRNSRKSCAARPQERGRHAVSNVKRAVSVKNK